MWEQRPIAVDGAGQMAENARKYMAKEVATVDAMTESSWGNAYTRGLLAVRLDVDRTGDTSMIKSSREPLRLGDRFPDWMVHGPDGREHRIHDFNEGNFLALYFADVRRRPPIPENSSPAIRHFVVSRWDAPLDGGLRDRALLDPGGGLFKRAGCPDGTLDPGASRRPYRRHRADQGRHRGGVLSARRRRAAALLPSLSRLRGRVRVGGSQPERDLGPTHHRRAVQEPITPGSIAAGRSCPTTTVATMASQRSLKAIESADVAGGAAPAIA